MAVLILGGTSEGRRLADAAAARGIAAITSCATEPSRRPAGELRIGGFGGVEGLARSLAAHGIQRVVDATHPFAARMTANAAEACRGLGVPLLRVQRPGWGGRPDAARWHWVDTFAEARDAAERMGGRAFLAIGRTELDAFASWADRDVVVRLIDPPAALPSRWTVIAAVGPFAEDAERELLRREGIGVLVCKDAGGPAHAKLDAAAHLGADVVIVRRPPLPDRLSVVGTVADALAWLGVPQPVAR